MAELARMMLYRADAQLAYRTCRKQDSLLAGNFAFEGRVAAPAAVTLRWLCRMRGIRDLDSSIMVQ